MTRQGNAVRADIGIIGGSGLYDVEGLRKVKELSVKTPFGAASDKVVLGELDGIRIAFLSRHGRGHRVNPSEINYRANIYALKSLGVRRVISVSAVGSMKNLTLHTKSANLFGVAGHLVGLDCIQEC